MKSFGAEEMKEIREDWKRNEGLGQKERLERVAQLHACGQKDIARALELEAEPDRAPEQGEKADVPAKHMRKRADPATRQAVIKDVLLEGMTQAEAAEKYGVPPGTVRTWVWRARKTRQEFLDYPEPAQQAQTPAAPAPERSEKAARPLARHQSDKVREVLEGIRGGERFRAVMEESRILSDEEMVALDQILEHALIYRDGFEAGLAVAGEDLP